jgi:hypothetical protein
VRIGSWHRPSGSLSFVDQVTSPRTSTASIGILMVVLATGFRSAFVVIGMLVSAGVLDTGSIASVSPIPIFALDTAAGVISMILLAGLLVMSVASIWGLLRRDAWGWTLSIVTAGVMLALNLGWWAVGDPHYLSMILNSIAVFYLNQRDLRAVFGVGRGG